jgi:CheY-like chemotaxis protein
MQNLFSKVSDCMEAIHIFRRIGTRVICEKGVIPGDSNHVCTYHTSFKTVTEEEWQHFLLILIDAGLVEEEDEADALEHLQKMRKRRVVFISADDGCKADVPYILFRFRPYVSLAFLPGTAFFRLLLNYLSETENAGFEPKTDLSLDPFFLFFSHLSHELRELLNGLSGVLNFVSGEKKRDEHSDSLKTLFSSQENLLYMLEKWSELVYEGSSNGTKRLNSVSINALVDRTRSFYSKRALFGERDIHWDIPLDDSDTYNVDATLTVLLWIFYSSYVLKTAGFNRAQFNFSKCRVSDENYIEFTITLKDRTIKEITEFLGESKNTSANDLLGFSVLRLLMKTGDASLVIYQGLRNDTIVSLFVPATTITTDTRSETPIKHGERTSIYAKKLHFLLAEDDRISQKLTEMLIKKKGWSIQTVSNGAEAVRELTMHLYDIVLMDIQMPVMDGLEAIKQIRLNETHSGTHIPVIALTAYTLRDERMVYLRAGMDAWVSKPIVEEELYATVFQVWGKFSEANTFLENPPANINRVLSLLEGDREDLSGLIREFLKYFPDQMEAIKRNITDRNTSELAKTAHKLKGSISSFDAKRCFELALELENVGKSGNVSTASRIFDVLETEMARLKEYLINFL